MKQFRRFAALFITVVLLVSSGVMTAFAYTSDPVKPSLTFAADLLKLIPLYHADPPGLFLGI